MIHKISNICFSSSCMYDWRDAIIYSSCHGNINCLYFPCNIHCYCIDIAVVKDLPVTVMLWCALLSWKHIVRNYTFSNSGLCSSPLFLFHLQVHLQRNYLTTWTCTRGKIIHLAICDRDKIRWQPNSLYSGTICIFMPETCEVSPLLNITRQSGYWRDRLVDRAQYHGISLSETST